MRIGTAVVDRLAAHGIEAAFGIPGTQTLPLNEAVESRDDMRFVMARHETAVSHQAWGYAETSGRPAATVVVPGPGDMNAMNGLKNAYNDCTPLVHLSVETDPEIRGGDGIHETPPDTYDNVVKENVTVTTPGSTLVEVDRAVAAALTPPKGPVRIGIPKGFLGAEAPRVGAGAFARESVAGVPDDDVRAAADLLGEADEPVVVAGGGVRSADASESLRSVAETLGAPVVTTYKGKGVLPEDHDLSAGVLCGGASPDLVDLIESSGAALGVGTDFDAVATRQWSIDLPPLVHVTLDADDVGTGYEPAVGIVADAGETLARLDDLLSPRDGDGAERAGAVREADAERMAPLREVEEPPLPSVAALAAVREALPREAVVGVDAGGFRIWTLVSVPAYGPRRYVNPGSWATMGSGLPSAIGAAVANPDAPVVALTGDGGLMMCLHELHTAVAEGLALTVVVFNNDDYAIISEEAEAAYGLEESEYGWTDAPVSFTTVAEGMGLEGRRAETPDAIRAAVADAVESDAPRLIEVPTDPHEPQASAWMRE